MKSNVRLDTERAVSCSEESKNIKTRERKVMLMEYNKTWSQGLQWGLTLPRQGVPEPSYLFYTCNITVRSFVCFVQRKQCPEHSAALCLEGFQ